MMENKEDSARIVPEKLEEFMCHYDCTLLDKHAQLQKERDELKEAKEELLNFMQHLVDMDLIFSKNSTEKAKELITKHS